MMSLALEEVINVGAEAHLAEKKPDRCTNGSCLVSPLVDRGPFMGTGTQVLRRHRMKECLILGLVGPHDK